MYTDKATETLFGEYGAAVQGIYRERYIRTMVAPVGSERRCRTRRILML